MLNVYVPDQVFLKEDEMNLPVMVWIHGGALEVGWNAFSGNGPNEFMKRNTILVAINYRLGPFGFLTLGTESVSGNMGKIKIKNQNLFLIT